MPAARYWRLVALDVENRVDLRLAQVELRAAGVRVDASATITSTTTPTLSAVADLNNGLTTNDVRFAAADVLQPGFQITWDFGADTTVDEFKLVLPGGAPAVNFCELHYLSATGWVLEARWFGRFTNTSPRLPDNGYDPDYDSVIFQLSQDPVDTGRLDLSKKRLLSYSAGNGTYIAPTPSSPYQTWGSTILYSNLATTNTTRHVVVHSDSLTGDFSVEAFVIGWNNGTGGPANIVSFGPSTSSWGLTVGITTSGNVSFRVRNASGVEVIVSGNFPYLVWRFVRWVRQSGVHKLFVDGVERGSFTDSSNIAISEFRMGAFDTGSVYSISWNALRVTKDVVRTGATPTGPFPEPPQGPVLQQSPTPTRISAYTPPATVTAQLPQATRFDTEDYGTLTLAGTVKRKGDPANVPLQRRVRLYNEIGRRLVRETWSDPVTGAFVFENLLAGPTYTAVAYDYENNYRALVVDNLKEVI